MMKRNISHDNAANDVTTEESGTNVLDFSTTLKDLKKTVDPNLVRQRAGMKDREGNVRLVDYVEWHTVADILDENAPNWEHTIKDMRSVGEIFVVTVAITIDNVTREGIGTGRASSETGIKKAEHDALKRAAVKFGIARELYKREFDAIGEEVQSAPMEVVSSSDPIARNIGDMITGKQLGLIRAIARETGINVHEECSKMMRCNIDELSKRAASELIDHLQQINTPTAVPMRRAS
jgi:hypothetical protein